MTDGLVGYAGRLAYARWLRHLATAEAPTNADLGRAAGRTGQWASQWMKRVDAPPDADVRAALADYLGVSARWLFESIGPVPRPELWSLWEAERTRGARRGPGATRRVSGGVRVEVSAGKDITHAAEAAGTARGRRKPGRPA